MSNQRNAADRVRPFLQAMEKSIMAARQRRLSSHHHQPEQASLTVAPPADPLNVVDNPNRPRQRARPKRPSNVLSSYDNNGGIGTSSPSGGGSSPTPTSTPTPSSTPTPATPNGAQTPGEAEPTP